MQKIYFESGNAKHLPGICDTFKIYPESGNTKNLPGIWKIVNIETRNLEKPFFRRYLDLDGI